MNRVCLIGSLLLLLFNGCRKDFPESEALIGKWTFVKAEDTTYAVNDSVETSTHNSPGLTYQFTLSGYLLISPSWQDKMKYDLRNSYELIIVTARREYHDTIINSTKNSLIFKEWHTEPNGDVMKSTVYLER
jgi:hypothetical protein